VFARFLAPTAAFLAVSSIPDAAARSPLQLESCYVGRCYRTLA